jgi:hypothetical protein
MRAADIIRRLDDQPFKPFRLHLSDGTLIELTQPGMVIVGNSSAVVPTRFTVEEGRRVARDWRTVALAHILQMSDLDESIGPRRRGRR